ncbi:murein hydrolase activator EnvC family protein [Neobacillus niacini]|uniref:murein hydrolase activator EnvC family protein n=1 Tax=Neobacillus niacini TaxID=86668 RepID=UPI00203E3119|nr:peptidoglycan DD-metalloendopeptidase family protein [Neobacillus niacini]MCM3691729.1 peptidoglycan DD-metalloendopeptidase family protein [Neobacillus niacini]
MNKSFVTFAVAGTFIVSSIFGGIAEAASISSLQKQQQDIQQKNSELSSDINTADQQINSLNAQQADVKEEMTRIDLSIGETHKKIREKTAKLEETKVEITRLQEEIKVTKERIDKRNELLKDRARNYQKTGGMVSYLDVLMGSKNFSDFIDRASAVATIMQADQDILAQHEADKKSLEENQAKLEVELASVQTMLADLEKMNQQLNAQRAEKDRLLATLEEQEDEIHEHKMELQEEAQILAGQSAAIQKAIELEQQRQAAAAAEAKAAAEAATAAAAAANNNNAGSGSGGGESTPTPPSPPVSSGAFTMPANGTFTSGFAPRWGSFHYGIDIANRAANVPIWAAADGVVIQSYYSSSYGNVIFIAHSVNGQTYTTVSAHMEARLVSSGAVVKKGQQIGIMGNTGDSTGKHLHFELHRGQWNGSKSNAINPVGIVPMP